MNIITVNVMVCRYISNLMLDVPFPTMERPRVLMVIGTVHIVFSLPVQTPLPLRCVGGKGGEGGG